MKNINFPLFLGYFYARMDYKVALTVNVDC